MLESSRTREIVAAADRLQEQWSTKWFWRHRLPQFAETRTQVRERILGSLQHGKAQQHYFGLLSDSTPISFDAFVLQVMTLRERGYDFGLETTYHRRTTEWINDSPKHDNWETFEDCHTEVEKTPAWYEIHLVAHDGSFVVKGA